MNDPLKPYRKVILSCFAISALSNELCSAPIITEFVASNDSTLYDEDGQSSDWIEIYNPYPDLAELDGYYLTNDPDDLRKWKFPNISLPPNGYLIIFASNKDRDDGEMHTNFRLPQEAGGYLGLVDPDGRTVVSEFSDYPVQFDDFSYGIGTNGGNFTITLVREGGACKLLVPTTDIGTTWLSLDYNDEAWSDATTGVGYERSSGYENLIGAGGGIEELTYDINSTAYIRIPFSLDSVNGLVSLTFRMKYDDGFVAYINGTEIASGNKPESPGWDSDASSDHPDSQALSFVDTDLTDQASGILRPGNNVLAIHAMNGDTGSSDLLALPRLEAKFIITPDEGVDPNPLAPKAIYSQNFDGFDDGVTDLGDGSVISGAAASVQGERLQLTIDNQGLGFSSFSVPALPGTSEGFTATFDYELYDSAGANDPADGFSFNYGNAALGDQGQAEEGMAGRPGVTENLSFEVDTWRNGDAEQGVNISGIAGGADMGQLAFTNGVILEDDSRKTGSMEIRFDPSSGATFYTTGLTTNADFTDVDTGAFVADDGHNFIISARVGGANEDLFIDNLVITADHRVLGEAGYVSYFQNPSPGNNNGTNQGLPSGSVSFSQPGRGFTGSLAVRLSTSSAKAQIRYTTNGSLPTATSTLFTGSTINLSSSTLLRARAFEDGLTPGPVSEAGYVRLSSNAQNFSSDLPVIIMERFSNGGSTAANGKTFTFFAFFEPDPGTGRTRLNGPYSLGTRGGWKVRGSSSTSFAKKAFSIEAWNEFNRNKEISPLGFPEESDFILNARSVYDPSLMRNAFIYELSNQVGRYAVRTRFVELFKDDNGGNLSYSSDYDGVYTFMEKISRDKNRVNVERLPESVTEEPAIAGGYILKVDRLDPGDSGLRAGGRTLGWVYPKEEDVTTAQLNWTRDFINTMSSALDSTEYEDYIDTLSWVDHHLLNILTLNADALRLSTFFHKTRNGKLEYGPIWDFDRSMESTDGRDNNPSTWSGGTSYFTFPWWAPLFENENFWQVYIDRYFELRDGAFATLNVHAIIDRMTSELNEAQVRNFQRWSDQPRFGSFQGEVNHLKDWLDTRLEWMDGQFAPRPQTNRPAGIYPEGITITLSAPLAGNQKIYYTLDGSDPRQPADAGTLTGTVIVAEDVPVRALVPNSNIGSSWYTDTNFNDASWLSGSNGVGYERSNGYDPYINIDLDNEMSGRTSCYVRVKFNVTEADLEEWNFMMLQVRYDDGFVAYLNGTQIASAQAPGNLTWNSSATQTHDDGSATLFQKFDASSSLGQLKPGQNLLAIHALNESTSSSDFLNQVRLIAGFDEGAGEGGTNGSEYTGPITLNRTARIFARVFDRDGGHSTSSGQTPVGTGWSAPLKVEYLVNEVPASASNLAITEIMYHPYEFTGPETSNNAFEWIELQNVSSNPISLTGAAFTDGIEFTFPGLTLEPGQRTLVVGNLNEFKQIYGNSRTDLVAGKYSGALDNGGESITLISSTGANIQTFTYPDGIADEGFSLVLDGVGWRPSRTLLGSPGTKEPTSVELPDVLVNEVLTNSVLPQLDMIELHNPNPFPVNLSGWLLTDDLREQEKFRIPEGNEVAGNGYLTFTENDFTNFALDSFGEEVFLIADSVSSERLGYVDGFRFGDAGSGFSFGRHITSDGKKRVEPMSFQTFGSTNSEPVSGPLVITELMYHPDSNEAEYIEIQNVGTSSFDLQGTEISGVSYRFDNADSTLGPGEILLLIKGNPATFRSTNSVPEEVSVYGPFQGSLDNGGERLRIRTPEKSTVAGEPDLMVSIDIVDYSDQDPWPVSADGGGDSLHRSVPPKYGGDPANWKASDPSPGASNNEASDWRSLFFTPEEMANSEVSGPLADADSDGIKNILEYLLGSDPKDPSSRIFMNCVILEQANNVRMLELTFKRRKTIKGYTTLLESSTDLVTWSPSDEQLVIKEELNNEDGTVTLTYQTVKPLDPLSSGELYFRVRASESP